MALRPGIETCRPNWSSPTLQCTPEPGHKVDLARFRRPEVGQWQTNRLHEARILDRLRQPQERDIVCVCHILVSRMYDDRLDAGIDRWIGTDFLLLLRHAVDFGFGVVFPEPYRDAEIESRAHVRASASRDTYFICCSVPLTVCPPCAQPLR